jgi:hypothetical protein
MFKVRKNILSTKEKNKLLKFVKTKVKSIEGCPGLQTDPNLHTYREMDYFLDKIKNEIKNYHIVKCWANYTDGSYIAWHEHPSKYALVYYLYSPENLGVMFQKENNIIEYTKGLENSIVMFNSNKIHSVPNSPKKINRYSIAVDLQ